MGTSDLNSPIADPEYLGYLSSNPNTDLLVHSYLRETAHTSYPTLLENSSGNINLLYPNETLQASHENNGLFAKFESKDQNLLFTLSFLEKSLKTDPASLFKYRLRTRNNTKLYSSEL